MFQQKICKPSTTMMVLLSIFITACGGGGGGGEGGSSGGSGSSSAIPLISAVAGSSSGETGSAVAANPITVGPPGAVSAGASGPVAINANANSTPTNVESTNLVATAVVTFPAAAAVSLVPTLPATSTVVVNTVPGSGAPVSSTIVTKPVAVASAPAGAFNPPVVAGSAPPVVAASTTPVVSVSTTPVAAVITRPVVAVITPPVVAVTTPPVVAVITPPVVAVTPLAPVNNPIVDATQQASTAKPIAPPAPKNVMLWSDRATWGGSKPVAGAAVLVPSNMKIVLDENTPALGDITIEGELSFQPGVTAELSAATIRVQKTGVLRAGSLTTPFTGHATITLTSLDNAASAVTSSMGTRGILVSGGGKLELFGAAPAVPWTRLSAHAVAGSTALTLERNVGWKAGDQIVVAPTEWYGNVWVAQSVHNANTATQRLTLASSSANIVQTTSALSRFRWGLLQYMTDSGISLTKGAFNKPHPDAVDTLDERAEVGNLSRNIVIQGANDVKWTTNGFGAHIMVMDLASSLQLDGVELRRMGQEGLTGRYPIHWHLLSYAADGTMLGDASNHFVRNSSVWDSRNRCMVLHGTNGVSLTNNICYDLKGHAIFLEDAVERRNKIEGNLVLRVRSPIDALAVTAHEKAGHMCGASAAYWLTNPDNTVRNNVAADAQGNGFWLSYPQKPVKQNKNVPLRPQNMAHGPFEFNSTHSNGNNGIMLECAMIDDIGNLELLNYSPTTDGKVFDHTNGLIPVIKGISTTKNNGGYVNRVIQPSYVQWAAADNLGRAISGAVQYGSSLKHSLIIGKSLNDRQSYPVDADPPLAVASYHSQMDITQNTFAHFANAGNVLKGIGGDVSSGTFGTNDYYIRPVEKGMFRNSGNRLIAADAGYRAIPPHLQPGYTAASKYNWTLSGALWDPHGYWSTPGRYVVLDSPFLTNPDCTALKSSVPAGIGNSLSCAGPYYGIGSMQLDRGLSTETNPYAFFETLDVSRLDSAGNSVGRWRVEQGYTSVMLGNMRHFAAVNGGTYVVRFPDFPNNQAVKSPPKWVNVPIENMLTSNDSIVLGVHYDGATAPSRVFLSPGDSSDSGANSRNMTSGANRAAVVASAGNVYWRDTANNLIWVKIVPFTTNFWAGEVAGSDFDLYRSLSLRIEQ